MAMKDLPAVVQTHLLNLIESSGLPDSPEFRERLAGTWNQKSRLFEQQVRYLEMDITDLVSSDDPRGMIILTYSGSIVSIGPLLKSREVEYASIHLRGDVPKSVVVTATELAGDVEKDKQVSFTTGRLKKTSAAFMIAVCSAGLTEAVQGERIREAMIYLTNGFLKINQSIHIDRKSVPDHFTSKSMSRYIAKRHDLTGVQAQKILEDFSLLIETGMLLGESVPLGKVGRLSLKKKEAQKARVVRHPETGEEITVKSKPSVAVPRISFSRHIKEKAAALPLEEQDSL